MAAPITVACSPAWTCHSRCASTLADPPHPPQHFRFLKLYLLLMKTSSGLPSTLAALALFTVPGLASAQSPPVGATPGDAPEMALPASWVTGAPGAMTFVGRPCRSLPESQVRERVVELAIREWAFFGFPVLDRVEGRRLPPPGSTPSAASLTFEYTTRRISQSDPAESARVAAPIAGYWAVTPEGSGIVRTQNGRWASRGVGARWNAPWSAAFISWVMCEGGLGTRDRFQRAIAHWTYIDQAIRARDGRAPDAAFVAHDIGEQAVEPGDLLCSGRRPAYRSLAQRRRQMGAGASTHCDIVVAVDAPGERILAIGGNVLRSVSLKVLAGVRDGEGGVRARSIPGAPLFAHLRLQADPMAANGLAESPILTDAACSGLLSPAARGRAVLALLDVEGPWNEAMASVGGFGERADGNAASSSVC